MKIISYGHVKPKVKTCEGCGAVYEYLPRDVETLRAGSPSARNFVRCPVCGHSSWVHDVFIKHDVYTVFQNVDRANVQKVVIDREFVNTKTNRHYSFKVFAFVTFDGPPLGDSMLKMVEDSVASVVEKELSDVLGPIDIIPLDGVETYAMTLTNIAMSKITTRANLKCVKIVSVDSIEKETGND